MSRKQKGDKNVFVFSTDPNFRFEEDQPVQNENLTPGEQKLTVRLDKKHRGGKMVSLVQGFIGKEEDLEQLGKQLKNFCGTGGSAKDGEIVIQGDQRDKMVHWLVKNGFSKTKKI